MYINYEQTKYKAVVVDVYLDVYLYQNKAL